MDREDVRFRSVDAECAGWLYRPADSDGDVPCVVLAHGFGGVKEARLDAYAERFAAAGYAALVFDYRHHGDSAGEPRLLIDVGRQHADWRAAIAYARALDGVDANRIVAWGTSFSGGHVVEIAAADHRHRGRDRPVAVHERRRGAALRGRGPQPAADRRGDCATWSPAAAAAPGRWRWSDRRARWRR